MEGGVEAILLIRDSIRPYGMEFEQARENFLETFLWNWDPWNKFSLKKLFTGLKKNLEREGGVFDYTPKFQNFLDQFIDTYWIWTPAKISSYLFSIVEKNDFEKKFDFFVEKKLSFSSGKIEQ